MVEISEVVDILFSEVFDILLRQVHFLFYFWTSFLVV